jgi:hypothetical protein
MLNDFRGTLDGIDEIFDEKEFLEVDFADSAECI